MLIAAILIYAIFTLIVGRMWPLQLLAGKAGPLGYILVIGWLALLIAGIIS
jgi:hypothetical protein